MLTIKGLERANGSPPFPEWEEEAEGCSHGLK